MVSSATRDYSPQSPAIDRPSVRPPGEGRRRRGPLARILVVMLLLAALLASAVLIDATRRGPARATVVALQHGARPLRVLLVGDSMAGTLGVGLARAAEASGVTLVNGATGGCSVGVAWDGGWPASILGPVPTTYPCRSSGQLMGYWRTLLLRYRPDVVIYVARVDTVSQKVGAHMTSILDPPFQSYLENALSEAVATLTSTGAHVLLATSAPTKIGLGGNANDDPRRWSVYGRILASVAARSPQTVSVFDLGRFFGGTGAEPVFQLDSPSGIQWRCTDGIHFSAAAGILVAPALFGAAWHVAGPLPSDTSSTPKVPAAVANQPWAPYASVRQVLGCPS